MRTVLSPYLRTAVLVATATSTAAIAAAAAAATVTAQDQDRPLDADFEEVYRVGGATAPEWAQFSMAGTVAFDGSGNVFMLDILAERRSL